MDLQPLPLPLGLSAHGRVSGKAWKARKSATVYINSFDPMYLT